MIRDTLLVAAREFRQITSTKGFWIMLLIVPLAIAVSGFASAQLAPKPGTAYVLVDKSGQFEDRLEERLEFDYQRQSLRDLSTYAERWDVAAVDPSAPWSNRSSWLADREVARFVEMGGTDAALAKLAPHLPKDADPFEAPERLYWRVPAPPGVPIDQGPEAFGKAMAAPLKEDVQTPAGKLPLALAIYIPEPSATPGPAAHVWTNGQMNSGLLGVIAQELTTRMRLGLLEQGGFSPQAAAQVEMLNAPINVVEPPLGEEHSIIATQSIIPIALMYLLLITAVTTGSMMLQGLVEERSNKLLESVLACIRPATLMNGKLIGLGGVGLGIVLVWAGCAAAAAMSSSGGLADALRTSFDGLEPWMLPAMLFYFLSGYLTLSMLFLAIGSLSDSMQDAQSYLAPVLIVIMLPIMIMMQASLRDPNAVITLVLSWIPIYTPFAMLARLGTGVSVAEVIGTTALLVGFLALELILLGRLFQASVLSAGKPGWRDLFAKMKRDPA